MKTKNEDGVLDGAALFWAIIPSTPLIGENLSDFRALPYVNIFHFNSGMYLLKIVADSGSLNRKILVE